MESHRRSTHKCASCGYVQEGDEAVTFYLWDGRILCDVCVDGEVEKIPRPELFERLGAEAV